MSHLLKEVEMKALACVIRVGSERLEHQIKEALTPLTSRLDLDDVGYFYHPADEGLICTVPGQLHGVMSNQPHQYVQLGRAVEQAVAVLNGLDEDYRKVLVVVSDRAEYRDRYPLEQALAAAENVQVVFFSLNARVWLTEVFQKKNATCHLLTDVSAVEPLVKEITL
jgi:hypothetical protein